MKIWLEFLDEYGGWVDTNPSLELILEAFYYYQKEDFSKLDEVLIFDGYIDKRDLHTNSNNFY